MQETWVRSLGWEDLLEKEMPTRFSILVLQKPVLEKPSTTLRELENSGLLHQRAQRR